MRILKFFLFFCVVIILLASSVVNLYDYRHKIFSKIIDTVNSDYVPDASKEKLAKDILNGGYILIFRHAEREKWIDVTMYDSYESINSFKAEKSYFKNAVCLSDRGHIQAKMMGEFIKKYQIPISKVITSPSCRARQTAELVFGGFNEINHAFLHYGPFNETKDEFFNRVKKEILKLKIEEGKNVIISAHNSVVELNKKQEIFDKVNKVDSFTLEEGG
ncbi:histidine phosphatase family protein, partial [Alphaproteobacteria bacterium]|nr:histidine phosphatase family protein [Alphaproteobacteria bacterium]